MNKIFGTLCATALMLTLSVTGCGDTKKAASEKAEDAADKAAPVETVAPAAAPTEAAASVAGTKTVTLANGASVTWIQDNDGERLMPRSLFSDASDSLYSHL